MGSERTYCIGDGPATLQEVIESLVNSGADGLEILASLKRSLSDEEWGEIVQSFGVYYAS